MSLRERYAAVRTAPDRGAIGVIVAFTLAALLGFAAIAVNVGAAFDEHRQVRNGADAVALAVASHCGPASSVSEARCSAALAEEGPEIANDNAFDSSTLIQQVCASRAAAIDGLPSCRVDNLAPLNPDECREAVRQDRPCRSLLSHCPEFRNSVDPMKLEYLEVRTRSASNDRPAAIGSAFGAEPGPVDACARVGFLPPSSLTSGLPITVSKCILDLYKAQHGGLVPPSPYTGSQARSWETAIVLHSSGKGALCAGPAGKNTPGNFGYLDANGAEPCQAYTEVNTFADGDTGNGNPKTRGCSDAYLRSLLGKTIPLPVFDVAKGTGANTEYRIIGYTGFHFTGWKLAGTSNTSEVARPDLCGGPDTCLFGMFTRAVTTSPVPVDLDAQDEGRDLGASTPALWD